MWDFDTGVSYEIGYRSYIVFVIWTDYQKIYLLGDYQNTTLFPFWFFSF